MSDETKQDESELLTLSPESAADGADDTDNGEQKQESINLEDESSKNDVAKGEEQKLKQIKAYQSKLDSGELTLDSIPKDAQWVKAHLKAKSAEPDKAAIEKYLSDRESDIAFKAQKQLLEDANLPSDKIIKFNEKYTYYRSKGLSKLDALTEAKEFAQIDLDEERINVKRERMKLPKAGQKTTAKDYETLYKELPYAEAVKRIPEKELNEILKRNGKAAR